MAAAYETGSASGPTELLTKLVTWLVAQGWTSDKSEAYGAGWRAHLHKGSQYVHLRAFVNEDPGNLATGWGTGWYTSNAGYGLAMYVGTGYSGAAAWNAQAGGPFDVGGTKRLGVGMHLDSAAIPAYHFLDDGQDNIMAIADRGAGLTGYLGWGLSLVKTGYTSDHWYIVGSASAVHITYLNSQSNYGQTQPAAAPFAQAHPTSGSYFATAFVRTDASVYGPQWLGFTNNTTNYYQGYTGRLGRCALDPFNYWSDLDVPRMSMLVTRGLQTAYSGALLMPLLCFGQASTGRWIPLGYPRHLFMYSGVGHGVVSGSVISVGGVNYLAFANFAVLKAA